MQRRRYSKGERVVALVAAEASSVLAASEQTGIPRRTLRDWLDDPKYAIYRQNAREAMAEEAQFVARLAWQALGKAIEDGQLDGRDLVMAAGMATDKAQLLNGGATSRMEARDITGSLSDDDLRVAVHAAVALTGAGRTAPETEGTPEG